MPRPTIEPERTALLVMDYQHLILNSLPNAETLLASTAHAIRTVRRHGGHIAYVRLALDDADYDQVPATSRLAPMVETAGRSLHAASPTTAVHDHIAPEPGDIIVRKTRIGAFSTTNLDQQLREREIHTLILAGLTTSGVVLSTLRDAFDRDYQVLVLADATTDREPNTHNFLLRTIFPHQAHVLDSNQLDDILSPTDDHQPQR